MPIVIYGLPAPRPYYPFVGPVYVGPYRPSILGYFHGCPAPQLPVCRVPMPILRNVAARCCVTPPFLPLARWFVTPPVRYIFPPVLVWRR